MVGDRWAGWGANPWHVDANTQSVLFLTDEGDRPVRIGLSVTATVAPVSSPATGGETPPVQPASGVTYHLTSLSLAPHETLAIDFRALRDMPRAFPWNFSEP